MNLHWTASKRLHVVCELIQDSAFASPLRIARQRCADALNDATKARRLSIELESVEYAAELSKELAKYGMDLEKLYMALNKKVKANVNDEKQYASFFKEMDAKEIWFQDAQARF